MLEILKWKSIKGHQIKHKELLVYLKSNIDNVNDNDDDNNKENLPPKINKLLVMIMML